MALVDGIHQYTEADAEATASDLLNLLGDSVRNRTNDLATALAAIVPFPESAAARSSSTRRPGSGAFSSGSMVNLATLNLPGTAPAGVWRVDFVFKVSASAPTTVNLRGLAGGSTNLTADEPMPLGTTTEMWTIPTTFVHPGGALALGLFVQIAGGTGTAPAGSRIVANWEGPSA